MKNIVSNPWRPSKCPFRSLNNRLQTKTKKSISKTLTNKQATKHMEYVRILKNSFKMNENYFVNIQHHISKEDIELFKWIKDKNNQSRLFLNQKIKEYFWNWFSFADEENLTSREVAFQKIGNLGLDDVAQIVDLIWWDDVKSLELFLSRIDEEITVRLKNNVLIDAILHLDGFDKREISQNKELHASEIKSLIVDQTNEDHDRYSVSLIPEDFIGPMTADGMIDKDGVIPQVTFGCPLINLESARVFRLFIRNFVIAFFADTKFNDQSN